MIPQSNRSKSGFDAFGEISLTVVVMFAPSSTACSGTDMLTIAALPNSAITKKKQSCNRFHFPPASSTAWTRIRSNQDEIPKLACFAMCASLKLGISPKTKSSTNNSGGWLAAILTVILRL